jgi:ceramide glucosyltransferase
VTFWFRFLWLIPLIVLVGGSIGYCALAILAAIRYRNSGVVSLREFPAVSVLRPMSGDRDNTEAGLRSVFEQDYPEFEVILGAASPNDLAVPIARRIMAEYPARRSRLVFTGDSPFPNRKVWQLRGLWLEAANETIVMADSDIRWAPDCLKTLVSELSQDGVGLVTCPYRAVAGRSLWSQVEALGLNVDFISGMLTARMLSGMDYAIGCTIATRRSDMEAIGGLQEMQPYLSEDFVIGNRMHNSGRTVVLSRSVIEHYIGSDSMRKNWAHRLRWARGTRRSRPAGYLGEVFTKPTVPAIALWLLAPGWGALAGFALLMRLAVVWIATVRVLSNTEMKRRWWLLPMEDVSTFATWILGFFGNTLTWRGHKLVIGRDGTVEMCDPAISSMLR